MVYSSSLTDKEWEIIKLLLPSKKLTRPPKWSKREILDDIFAQLSFLFTSPIFDNLIYFGVIWGNK